MHAEQGVILLTVLLLITSMSLQMILFAGLQNQTLKVQRMAILQLQLEPELDSDIGGESGCKAR